MTDPTERTCNNCGASDWAKVADVDYPERRRERDRTVKNIYVCRSCDATGRYFDQQDNGTEQFSGAMR